MSIQEQIPALKTINDRLGAVNKHLPEFYMKAVFNCAAHITKGEYKNSYWDYVELSNGGFYMLVGKDRHWHCWNDAAHWDGSMTPRAFSVAVNIYACSQAAFQLVDLNQKELAAELSDNYYRLRDYAFADDSDFTEDEVKAIYWAID